MTNDIARTDRPPAVNLKGLQERKLLQTELLAHDGQLRYFTPLRDRLVASGQDADEMYRRIASRRDQVMAELRILTPSPPRPVPGGKFVLRPGGYWGKVQMGRGHEGSVVNARGKYPSSGSIYTVALNDTGGIAFDADLAVGPREIPANQYDPSLQYFWLHNWTYFIPFPAPAVTSTFTYRFDVVVVSNILLNSGPATFTSFVSVGETADFVGDDLEANTDAGWPLVADLTQPNFANGNNFNGHYGNIQGRVTVQRSFSVGAGQVPAVAVVLGVVSAQAMMSEVFFEFPSLVDSYISSGSFTVDDSPGIVNFNYNHVPIVVGPLP